MNNQVENSIEISSRIKSPKMGLHRNRLLKGILFVLPAISIIAIFFVYPILSSLAYSFTDWDGFAKTKNFIGFQNYKNMLTDGSLRIAIINTFEIAIFLPLFQNIIGLTLALLLDTGIKTKNIIRTFFYLPSILGILVVSYTWGYILSPSSGLLNTLLTNVGLESLTRAWLGDPKTVIPCIIAIKVWQNAGGNMLIFLAGLQTIPTELYESAVIEGANWWNKFKSITFPLLAPAITINIVLNTINALKAFELPFTLTQGGPGFASQVIALRIFEYSFRNNLMGYGTAISVVLTVMIISLTMVQLSYLKKREEIY